MARVRSWRRSHKCAQRPGCRPVVYQRARSCRSKHPNESAQISPSGVRPSFPARPVAGPNPKTSRPRPSVMAEMEHRLKSCPYFHRPCLGIFNKRPRKANPNPANPKTPHDIESFWVVHLAPAANLVGSAAVVLVPDLIDAATRPRYRIFGRRAGVGS